MRGEVEFEIRTPADDATLRRNVQHALTLGLPDLQQRPADARRLTIFANGPTAAQGPLSGPTLALNGALSLFTAKGAQPTWWAACDPQEIVAGFLADAPRDTTYLVASKCHPSVFDALAGRSVVLWHLDEHCYWDLVEHRDPIMVAPTITICAFEVAERLGFSRSQTWGWDGCYMDGRDHAAPQPHAGVYQENEVGERVFPTTRNWLLEAQNAVLRFRLTPRDVRIHGGGMVAAMFDYLDVLQKEAA